MHEPKAIDALRASHNSGTAPVSTDAQDDPSSRRLLLCKVLVEEYESLQEPPSDRVDQMEVDEIATIKQEIDNWRTKSNPEPEEKFNGEMTSRIYKLMATAQKRRAEAMIRDKAENYENAYGSKYQDQGEDRRKVADRAVVAEMYGHIEDLRWKYRQEYANVADQTERERLVESQILATIHREALGKEDDELEDGLKEASNGKTKKAGGMSRETAAKVLAKTLRSALCLSGGGIRSATFNLGILQGLARHGLLEKFDYLSTVSGGGFIGGWLSAWICRQGIGHVMNELGKSASKDEVAAESGLEESPKSPFKPDPRPVEHLRIYGNYLSPQPGLLSADTWTLIATFLRNLMLNWVVFVPVLALLLMLPRMWAAILFRSVAYQQYALTPYLVFGLITGNCAYFYIATNLPSSNSYSSNPCGERYKGGQQRFILRCLLWMIVSASSFAIWFWIRLQPYNLAIHPIEGYKYVVLAEAVIILPWIICAYRISRIQTKRPKNFYLILVLATLLILIAQFVTGYLLRYATRAFPLDAGPQKTLLYAIFAVPVILILMSIGATLIAGFTSHFTNDDDQEWWARTGAWMFIVIVAWCVLNTLVLYGPLLLLTLGTTYKNLSKNGLLKLPWKDLGKLFGTLVGIVSGIITLVGGFSAKTPANAKEAQKSGTGGMALAVLTTAVAPIFLAFVFILVALGTNWLLVSSIGEHLNSAMNFLGNQTLRILTSLGMRVTFQFEKTALPSPYDHFSLLSATSLRYLVAVLVVLALFTVIMGRLISTNIFSLQYMWRNRIIRAYLGASRKVRCPESFTGFDEYDNLFMSELRQQPAGVVDPGPRQGRPADDQPFQPRTHKLLHVLNLALNLAGGEKLQWQDRRAESFTVSPLHAGSYWLGYRRSFRYGGEEGISLGAAIAISGAFVSPNMGYMMTSPVIRFLMTLFNIRFGWWLGNPGPTGDKLNAIERIVNLPLKVLGLVKDARPFRLRSPGLSVIPIVSEAFGGTDDKSSYVYLSDGGHFENLGLYEMVLRRCRFIVVSDASTDPDYSFQSLAMSVRQIRVDLGVPIDIPQLAVNPPSQDMRSKYCAIGTIRYSCVDRDPNDSTMKDEDFDGVLIYLKPSLIGEEPRDVINYWQSSNCFPQEIIVDQWFSEAQFESYRALGSHIIDAICGGDRNEVNFAAFARKVTEHNQLDFRAFRDEISYVALEQQLKQTMQQVAFPSYRWKVRKFLDKLLR